MLEFTIKIINISEKLNVVTVRPRVLMERLLFAVVTLSMCVFRSFFTSTRLHARLAAENVKLKVVI